MLPGSVCAIAALLFSTIAVAQKPKTIRLEPTPFEIGGRAFYVDSVVDNRLLKEDVGEAFVGVMNTPVPVIFERSVAETIQRWFDVTIPGSAGQERLIAVVNDLRAEEKISMAKERGVATVEILFCKRDAEGLKVVAETFSEQESGAMDVSNSHAERLDLALRECLNRLNQSDWRDTQGTLLRLRKPYNRAASTVKARQWKYGTYRTFEELAANEPSNTSDEMLVPESEPEELVLIKVKSTKKKLVDVLAFSNGTDLYINTQAYNWGASTKGVFAKVAVAGRYVGWIDYFQTTSPTAAVVAFGITGYATSPVTQGAFALDMNTGVLMALGPDSMMKILEPERDLLKEYQITRRPDPFTRLNFIRRFNELHPE